VCSVIRLLNAKCERPAEIHKQIVVVYGNVINRQNAKKWCREFSEGRTDVHDEQRSSKPCLISDDLPEETEGEICANRRVTIRKAHHIIPEVFKTTIYEAETERLGYRKFCVRWVPKMLTDQKTKRMGFSRATHRKEVSFWTPLWLDMKNGVFTTLLNRSNSHCSGAIRIPTDIRIWRDFVSALPFQTRLTQSRFYHCQTSTPHR
jgi:hypothetical protein